MQLKINSRFLKFPLNQNTNDIGVDTQGNFSISGYFSETATFGAGELNETNLVSAGGQDIFLAKYTSSGSLIWAKRAGSIEDDQSYGIAVNDDKYCTISGGFKGIATFGAGENNETVLTSDGDYDFFIARYDTDGDLYWAKRAGSTQLLIGFDVAIHGTNALAVTGRLSGTATFGAGEANETVVNGQGDGDIFVALYDSSGFLQWVKSAGGAERDFGASIAMDTAGNIFVTGRFEDEVVFEQGEAQEIRINSAGEFDLYVAKWDISGNLLWVTQAGGPRWDLGYSIATDSNGNCLVTGKFDSTAVFKAGQVDEISLTSEGGAEIYFAEYTGEGELVRAIRAGGEGHDYGDAISEGPSGSVLITGRFQNEASFGTEILNSLGPRDGFVAYWVLSTDVNDDYGSVEVKNYHLIQNYPNPFNPITNIDFSLPQQSYVTLTVYDLTGREIAKLLNKKQDAGDYTIPFDGSNLPSGIYVYKLQAGQYQQVRKMILLK